MTEQVDDFIDMVPDRHRLAADEKRSYSVRV